MHSPASRTPHSTSLPLKSTKRRKPPPRTPPLPVLPRSTALLEQKSYRCPTRQVVTFCKTGEIQLWLCLKTQNSPCLLSNPSTHKHSWALKGHIPVALQVHKGKIIPGNSKETGSAFMNLWGNGCTAVEMPSFPSPSATDGNYKYPSHGVELL